MTWLARYVRSSVGAKHVMAVTGILLLLFALVHMLGHLQMFGGRDMYNKYADFLQNLWEVKWPVRAALLAFLLVHAASGIRLAIANRAARPVQYAVYRPVSASTWGRAMAHTGLIIFVFLAFHILHFTVGTIQPQYFHNLDHAGRYDAYGMFVAGFRQVWVYSIYFIGVGLLSLHLGHGAASWLQSLGLRHPKYRTDKIGMPISVLLFTGFIVPPTAVLVGIIS